MQSYAPLTDATPGYYRGECLVYEADPTYCRENITIAQAAGKVAPNTVMGKITASGKCVPLALGASDGSQNAVVVCIAGGDATNGDLVTGAWARDVALNGAEMNYNGANPAQVTAANAQLAALGIVVRPGA